MRVRVTVGIAAIALAGCARHVPPVAIAPPVIVPVAPAMPAGGRPGMVIPVVLADGSYATPNRALTPAATIWHLRAALNVAALACRGPDDALFTARYNAMLAAQRDGLKAAEATLAAEYRARGGSDWQNTYDAAMTRLYNYWSQDFARAGFCATAAGVLADAPGVDGGGFADFAAARLPALDRPFTDFYRAYDAWRGVRPAAPMVMASVNPSAMSRAIVATVAPVSAGRSAPRIELDPETLDIR